MILLTRSFHNDYDPYQLEAEGLGIQALSCGVGCQILMVSSLQGSAGMHAVIVRIALLALLPFQVIKEFTPYDRGLSRDHLNLRIVNSMLYAFIHRLSNR